MFSGSGWAVYLKKKSQPQTYRGNEITGAIDQTNGANELITMTGVGSIGQGGLTNRTERCVHSGKEGCLVFIYLEKEGDQ